MRLYRLAALVAAALLWVAPMASTAFAQDTPVIVQVAPPDNVVEALTADPTVVVTQTPAGDTIVSVPAGDIVSTFLGWGRDILIIGLTSAVAFLFRNLPKTVLNRLLQDIVQRNIVPAIDYGINAVAGAVRDQVLTVDIGSKVVAQSLQYFIDHAPGWLVKQLGGPERIKEMIIARIPLDSDATATAVARAITRPVFAPSKQRG